MEPGRAILDAADAQRLFAPLAGSRHELVVTAYLDPKWRLLGLRHMAGGRDWARPSIRTIVRDTLAFECTAVVLAHNHPSGDPNPSDADIAFTRACARTLASVGVTLTDHLILAASGWTSCRTLGLL